MAPAWAVAPVGADPVADGPADPETPKSYKIATNRGMEKCRGFSVMVNQKTKKSFVFTKNKGEYAIFGKIMLDLLVTI